MIPYANEELAYAYCRYSTRNQDDKSNDDQLAELREYAIKHDLKIVDTFPDEAISGSKAQRPQLDRMMQKLRSNTDNVKYVLVWKRDRVYRNTGLMHNFLLELDDLDVELISITQIYNDPKERVIMEGFQDIQAAYYLLNVREDIIRGQTSAARQCLHNGGRAPLGYKVTPDLRYEIEPSEAVIVQELFQLYASGKNMNEILGIFRLKGYRTRNDEPFGKNSFNSLLKQRKYIGEYCWNRRVSRNSRGKCNHHKSKPKDEQIIIPDGMPRIIDDHTFSMVQARLAHNKKNSGSYSAKRPYLFSGKIICGLCGHTFHGNLRRSHGGTVEYSSYRCTHRLQTGECKNPEIERKHLEAYVMEKLKNHLFNKDGLAQISKQINAWQQTAAKAKDTDIRQYHNRLNKIDKEIANISHAIAQGSPPQPLIQKLNELQKSKEAVEAEIIKRESAQITPQITAEQIDTALKKFDEFMKNYTDIPEAKKFIDQYIKQIKVFPDYIEVTFTVAFSFCLYPVISPSLDITVTATKDEVYEPARTKGYKKRKVSFAALAEEHGLQRIRTEILPGISA
ncbi:MAG: recombinase family protein [Oscillospiraceae bacterium]|nr:recombinase family protein [Oscillospiraceae bacterium]